MPGFLFMGIVDFEGAKPLFEPAQPPPTTTFARSRLPRSLLIAHYAVTGVWYEPGSEQNIELRNLRILLWAV